MTAESLIEGILRRAVFSPYKKWTIKTLRLVNGETCLTKHLVKIVRFFSTFHPDLRTCYSPLKVVDIATCDKAALVSSIESQVYTAKPQYYHSNYQLEPVKKKNNSLYLVKGARIVGASSLVSYSYTESIFEAYVNENDERFCFNDQGVLIKAGDYFIIQYKKSDFKIEKGIFLSGNFSGNYYHLLYDVMARINYYEELGVADNVPLIVDAVVRDVKQYRELLSVLNVKKRDVIYIEAGLQYHVDQLYYLRDVNFVPPHYEDFSKAVYTDCYFDLDVIKHIRKLILEHKSARVFPRRVFLSRKNASRRRRYNETDLYSLLSKYGFVEICPDEYTIADQAAIFNGADMIVGVTGAAFTNLVACKQNSRVLCIVPGYMDLSIFSVIAKTVSTDLQYYLSSTENNGNVAHQQFRVSIDDFEEKLKDWIGRAED